MREKSKFYIAVNRKNMGAVLTLAIYLLSLCAVVFPQQVVEAAAPAPMSPTNLNKLSIEPITAYNVIVDSNVLSPSSYGPSAATLGAKFCNTDDTAPLQNVWAYIGQYYSTTSPFTVVKTPGVYPQRLPTDVGNGLQNTVATDFGDTTRLFALEHEAGSIEDSVDASRWIGQLNAGECRTMYWLISYPRVATLNTNGTISRVSVTGGIKPDDDLWLEYDFWGTSTGSDISGAVLPASYVRRSLTMRNEISAMANKIWPNGDNKVPEAYRTAIAALVGWDTITPTGTTTVYPGQTVTSQGIWYDFGNIGAGFDNNLDFVPDRNAWVQPIGDHTIYDPGCFRLLRTYGLVIVKLNDGSEQLIPFVDQLYFENIPDNNNGGVGLVYYEYMSLDGTCTASLTPYQEVASGYDNEKFNGDYGAGTPPLSSSQTNIALVKSGPTTIVPSGQADYTLTFTLPKATSTTSAVTVGNVTLGMGLNYQETIPDGFSYKADSAAFVSGPSGTIYYSWDSGINWSTNQPPLAADRLSTWPDHKVMIQWRLSSALSQSVDNVITGQVRFSTIAPGSLAGPTVSNTGCLTFGQGKCFTNSTYISRVQGTKTISGTVFNDTGTSTNFANGIMESGETNLDAIKITLYYDVNADGKVDSGDTQWNFTDSGPISGKTYNYQFTDLPSGKYLVVVDTTDAQIPTGDALTTKVSGVITDHLSGDLTNASSVTGLNFGFAYPLALAKTTYGTPSFVSIGDTVQFQLMLTNNMNDSSGGLCYYNYNLWTTTSYATSTTLPDGGNQKNVRFLSSNLVIGEPDNTYTTINLANSANKIGLGGYTTPITNTSGMVIDSVDFVVYTKEMTGVNPGASLDVHVWYNNLDKTGTTYSFTASPNFTNTSGHTAIITQANLPNTIPGHAWTWSDFKSDTTSELQIVANKASGGSSGTLGIDAVGYIIHAHGQCGSPSTILNPVPVVDTFNNTELQFVSASITPNSIQADGTTTTLNWINVGPLHPQESKVIKVTYKALKAASPTTNYVSVVNPTYQNGNPANNPGQKNATQTITAGGSIAGLAFIDKNANNWSATNPGTGYDPGTDVLMSGVTATLYACKWDDGTGNVTSSAATYASNQPCTGQQIDNGSSAINGAWEAIATVITDSNGAYSFSSLARGFYYVSITDRPTGSSIVAEATDDSTTIAAAGGNATGHSTTAACGTVACDSLWGSPSANLGTNFAELGKTTGVSTSITNVNFGYTVTTAGIYGNIWYDANNNAAWNNRGLTNGEPGLSSVTVTLTYCGIDNNCATTGDNTIPPPATTDAKGYYSFGSLIAGGRYQVTVTSGLPTLPANTAWTPTSETGPGSPVYGLLDGSMQLPQAYLVAGNYYGEYNIGYAKTYTTGYDYKIGDTIYYDNNVNGTYTNAETYTDANLNGKYDSGETYTDANSNGRWEGAEEYLPNVTLNLYEDLNGNNILNASEPLITSTVSNASGFFQFTGLPLPFNNYIVKVDTSDSDFPAMGTYTETQDPDQAGTCTVCNSTGLVSSATLAGASLRTLDNQDFGYLLTPTGSIGDTVFIDANGNGISDTSETGINGVIVYLMADINHDGTYIQLRSTMTATSGSAQGKYLFSDLPMGNYKVVIDRSLANNLAAIPNDSYGKDYLSTTGPVVNGTTLTWNRMLIAASPNNLTADFGFAPPATIGDTVYMDTNGNGTQNSGETGVGGVAVSLYYYKDSNNNGRYDNTGGVNEPYTDLNGNGIWDSGDSFLDSDGNGVYTLGEPFSDRVGNGYWDAGEALTDTNGNGVWDVGETYTDTNTNGRWDAPETYVDLNGNGMWDAAEPLNDHDGAFTYAEPFVDTTTVSSPFHNGRLDMDETVLGLVDTTHTCDNLIYICPTNSPVGTYLFTNLVPGNYVVIVNKTTGGLSNKALTADPDADGAACIVSNPVCDSKNGLHLYYGSNFLGADFGYLPAGRIGDAVWIDSDNDGIFDANERGIPYINVNLIVDTDGNDVANNGEAVYTTTTDANGNYLFDGKPDSSLYVVTVDTGSNWPSGSLQNTYDPDASKDGTTRVTLSGGIVTSVGGTGCTNCDLNVDFGYRYIGNGSASGTVCLDYIGADVDNDANDLIGVCGTTTTGVDTNESAFANVAVYLYRWTDNGNDTVDAGELTFYGSATTSAVGDYSFTKIPDGAGIKYVVVIGAPKSNIDLTTVASDTSTLIVVESNPGGLSTPDIQAYQGFLVDTSATVTNIDFGFTGTTAYDFGDLPAVYSTTLSGSPDGARHTLLSGLYLGSSLPDTEENGLPSANALSDNTNNANDEDGVLLLDNYWMDNTASVSISVTGSGYLIGWIDFNKNGSFADSGEMVINKVVGTTVVPAPATSITLPANYGSLSGGYAARFRLFASAPLFPALAFSGPATGGEVEDYIYSITPTAVTIYDFLAGPTEGGVRLSWTTAAEIDNLGFNLYRQPAEGGDFVLLTPEIIPSLVPGQILGAEYEWLDTSADLQTQYVYCLEAIDIYGGIQQFEARYQPTIDPSSLPLKLRLPLVTR